MENYQTIYDICYDILYVISNDLKNKYDDDYEIAREILLFLLTDKSKYETVFLKFKEIDSSNKLYYKKIMRLIIVSSSYYLSLYKIEHNININVNKENVRELEKLSVPEIIKSFVYVDGNHYVVDYIIDYLEFIAKNYIFRNGCITTLLEKNKLSNILKINPFEIVNICNYIEHNNMLESEHFIQLFIDIYYAVASEFKANNMYETELYGNYNLIEYSNFCVKNFKEKIEKYFSFDKEKIRLFYSYIFSNIYESLIVLSRNNCLKKQYIYLLDLFEMKQFAYEELYDLFESDEQLAFVMMQFFIHTNDNILIVDTIKRRDDYIEVGDIDILKSLNPYYDEENKVFEDIKRKIKNFNS